MSKLTLEQWVHEAMVDGDKVLGGEQDHPLTAIALMHLGSGVGGLQKEVHTTKLTGGKPWKAADLAQLMQRKAENYCQDAGSVQWFAMLAFYGNGTPQREHPFLINVKAENMGFFSEGPDAKGEKQQAMRHLEMSQQQVYQQQQHLNNYMATMIQTLGRERAELMGEHREMTSVVNEMVRDRITNDHEKRMAQLSFERGTEMRNGLLKMAPPLVNTILGKNVFPQETSDTALIELIADSLTGAEGQGAITQIASTLPPHLVAALMTRMEKHLEKKRREQEERAKLLPPPGNPENDAAGGG